MPNFEATRQQSPPRKPTLSRNGHGAGFCTFDYQQYQDQPSSPTVIYSPSIVPVIRVQAGGQIAQLGESHGLDQRVVRLTFQPLDSLTVGRDDDHMGFGKTGIGVDRGE